MFEFIFIYVRPDLEVINRVDDLNMTYEELFPLDNGIYTITVKFYSFTISRKVNIENLLVCFFLKKVVEIKISPSIFI